jgi:uncharacterized protein with HEPN domain
MRSTLARLADARALALYAIENASGLDAETLADAKQPLHAALYDLLVIGEALSKVPEEWRSLAPEIPWAAIAGLRNRIAHAYWQLDLAIVAGVIENRLLPLVAAIDGLVATVRRAET